MHLEQKKIVLVVTFCLLGLGNTLLAQWPMDSGHEEVAMRMIGHQILLNANDSISRVLPIAKEGNRYKIEFESSFEFTSANLVPTIDKVLKKASLSDGYRVEVEDCDSNKVIYSYQMGSDSSMDIIPCGIRPQPKACYFIYITLFKPITQVKSIPSAKDKATENKSPIVNLWSLVITSALLLIILGGIRLKRKKTVTKETHLISLGSYLFDKRNSLLINKEEKIELSGKESELLSLLHSSANSTLEREFILKNVWGDDGDYVGRTLDVFISKLRKKLEADPNLKISNIRGIGYKLIIN